MATLDERMGKATEAMIELIGLVGLDGCLSIVADGCEVEADSSEDPAHGARLEGVASMLRRCAGTVRDMRPDCTRVVYYADDDAPEVCGLDEFVRDNEEALSPAEVALLRKGGVVRMGGGAAPSVRAYGERV